MRRDRGGCEESSEIEPFAARGAHTCSTGTSPVKPAGKGAHA